jgi:ATP-dependent helicase/nuclease subunit A
MTRARDNLILTASVTQKKWEAVWTKAGGITPRKILAAKSFADWLGLWFAQHANDANAIQGELPHLCWRVAGDGELLQRWGETPGEPQMDDGSRGRSPHRLETLDDETEDKLQTMLSWQYEFGAATARAAKTSVTALRRRAADESDDEAEQVFTFHFSAKRLAGKIQRRKSEIGSRKLSAAQAGVAHHKFLQYFSFESVANLESLQAEAHRLENENFISADEGSVLDLKAIAAFWESDAGGKILKHASNVKRELAFTAKFSPKELDGIFGRETAVNLENEFVVVQGVADLVVLLPDEIWLADFKTDEVSAKELAEKTGFYSPQLELYARALEKIYSRPVTNCWLHFLSARQTVDVKI